MAFGSVKLEVISRSLIKPSSSTPDHLRQLKLSVLDQLAIPPYVTVLFLYEADELNGSSTSTDPDGLRKNLQESLSATLTSFYPLAGELDAGNFSIICNDSGVEFVEARAHSRIEDVLAQKELAQLEEYVPVTKFSVPVKLFTVQINYLACGGIAVGVGMAHITGDGWSMFEFMNSWAAACRGEKRDAPPPYKFGTLGEYFPARDLPKFDMMLPAGNNHRVTKIFFFGKDQLAALQTVAATAAVPNPTRVEALSAFIWKTSIENYVADEEKKHFAAKHLLNFRSKERSFQDVIGNAVVNTTAFIDIDIRSDVAVCLSDLVMELRKSIRKIDEEYIEKMRTELQFLKDRVHEADMLRRGELEVFKFVSWSRFRMYDVDFGWGRPAWIALPHSKLVPVKDLAVLMETKDGEGIEAWITLPSHHVEAMENKYKLLMG